MKKIYITIFVIIATIIMVPMKVDAAVLTTTDSSWTIKVVINGNGVIKFKDGEVVGTENMVWSPDGGYTYTGKDYTYTGEEIEPSIEVYLGMNQLKKDVHYAVVYGNNKNVNGNSYVQVRGTHQAETEGGYTIGGSTIIHFHIVENDSTTLAVGDYNPFSQGGSGSDELISKANVIVNVIRNVGIVISVIALMIIGLKSMVLSASEKAAYKQAMPGYILGVFMVAAMSYIPSLIYNIVYKWN